MKNTPNRNGFIELCRFILALCVVSHHTIFYQEHGHIPFFGGYIAVEFFFILTGFFLFKSAKSGGAVPVPLCKSSSGSARYIPISSYAGWLPSPFLIFTTISFILGKLLPIWSRAFRSCCFCPWPVCQEVP